MTVTSQCPGTHDIGWAILTSINEQRRNRASLDRLGPQLTLERCRRGGDSGAAWWSRSDIRLTDIVRDF